SAEPWRTIGPAPNRTQNCPETPRYPLTGLGARADAAGAGALAPASQAAQADAAWQRVKAALRCALPFRRPLCDRAARSDRCPFLSPQTGSPTEAGTMLFTSLFRRLTRGPERDQEGRLRHQTPPGRRATRPRRFVPRLTALEDRWLPSAAHA